MKTRVLVRLDCHDCLLTFTVDPTDPVAGWFELPCPECAAPCEFRCALVLAPDRPLSAAEGVSGVAVPASPI